MDVDARNEDPNKTNDKNGKKNNDQGNCYWYA